MISRQSQPSTQQNSARIDSNRENSSEEQTEQLIVEIQLGAEVKKQLTLNRADDIDKLASNFCQEHGKYGDAHKFFFRFETRSPVENCESVNFDSWQLLPEI